MGTKVHNNYEDLITFTRASDGTYLDSDGLLKTASSNQPRVEYDADGNRLGLLVEESRTNLFTYSEKLSEKDENMSTSDNAAIAPDGNQTASFCKPTTFSTEHYIDDSNVTSGTDYAMSCFAKQGPGDYLLAFRGSGIGSNPPRFNLETGTIDNTGSADWSNVKIEDVGNGWYRCSAVANANNTTPLRFQITESGGTVAFAGDGTSGLYIWGCQIEQASFPTSYIATSGSTATRSADVASIPVTDFGYNQSEGTLFVNANAPDGSNQNRLTQLVTSGGATNRVVDLHRVTDDIVMYNGTTTMTGDAFAASNGIKAAGAYKSGSYALVSDGGSAITTSDSTVNTPDTLTIGMNGASARHLNGHIKSIKYYPRRLTNAQLQELTT